MLHCTSTVGEIFKYDAQHLRGMSLVLIFAIGDPRRPYPQDIEMRSGLLGRLGESETQSNELDPNLHTATPNLQEPGHGSASNGIGECAQGYGGRGLSPISYPDPWMSYAHA